MTTIDLQSKYTSADGDVFMTGVQALVRVLFDQMRLDKAAGLRTAVFASGYPGSPLGGFDRELAAQSELFAGHHRRQRMVRHEAVQQHRRHPVEQRMRPDPLR